MGRAMITESIWSCLILRPTIGPARSIFSVLRRAVQLPGISHSRTFSWRWWDLAWDRLCETHMLNYWVMAFPCIIVLANSLSGNQLKLNIRWISIQNIHPVLTALELNQPVKNRVVLVEWNVCFAPLVGAPQAFQKLLLRVGSLCTTKSEMMSEASVGWGEA